MIKLYIEVIFFNTDTVFENLVKAVIVILYFKWILDISRLELNGLDSRCVRVVFFSLKEIL